MSTKISRSLPLSVYVKQNGFTTSSKVCMSSGNKPFMHFKRPNGEKECIWFTAATIGATEGASIMDLQPQKLKVIWFPDENTGEERYNITNNGKDFEEESLANVW